MSTKRTIYLAAALVVALAAVMLLWLNVKPAAYPLSVTFVEWTDTFAPPAEVAALEAVGLRFSAQRGDWARLAVTNNGTKPLRFDSRTVEYESDGRWLQVPTNGWSGVHGKVWWPGTGSLVSVPRPSQVPRAARWRFHFVCALDPVTGVRRTLNQTVRKVLGKETLFFYAPRGIVSPEIPARQPNQDGAANGSQPIPSGTNRTSSAAGARR